MVQLKKFKISFFRFDRMHKRDGRTDGRADTAQRYCRRSCISLAAKTESCYEAHLLGKGYNPRWNQQDRKTKNKLA